MDIREKKHVYMFNNVFLSDYAKSRITINTCMHGVLLTNLNLRVCFYLHILHTYTHVYYELNMTLGTTKKRYVK